MSEVAVCLYNQRGYCKFKQNCRKAHENKTCTEDSNCKQKDCPYRHPKLCRNFSEERYCRFGDDCAYKHKEEVNLSQHTESMMKHSQEIIAMQEEIRQLKDIINKMQNQINILGQELEMSQKTNIEEIVKVVVSMIDSSKSPVKYGPAQKENNVIKCDHCSFKCEKEEIMVTHVREDHEECPYCYFCEEYFGTDKSLKYHNKQNHKEIEVHDDEEISDAEVKQLEKEKNKKTKKKKGRK